jgi:hypothetical protein
MLETPIYEVDATPGLKSKRTEKLLSFKHVEKKALKKINSQCNLSNRKPSRISCTQLSVFTDSETLPYTLFLTLYLNIMIIEKFGDFASCNIFLHNVSWTLNYVHSCQKMVV